ncbi:MAG: aminotransferase class III-fold pyridoxal phosphate-dependent enzyme, partial [Anaerolinea sp.]|nr:aminotransferase class III-fold pyridoxal phosphate-dependent enzyme [Anaerolinea sp.]
MTAQTVEMIQAWLVSQLSDLLKIDPDEINVYEPFAHYKLSSREIVLLSGDLEDWLKRQLSPTLFYEYPTIDSLARYLAGETAVFEETGVSPQPVSHEPIAVIGLSCRFPGTADPNAFWQLLQNGQDAITEVPAERWSLSHYYDPDPAVPGKMTTRWGGFLEQVDQFDPQFFKISPREAAYMDPQQRLLLEVAWEALENAALAPDTLALSQTGVFVGISSNDYARFQLSTPEGVDGYTGTGNAHSIAANRLSYLLNLRGPSLAVDTACSSSLVAVSLACDSLLQGKCDLALAGGVNLILTPELTISFSKAQLMSPDGRCMAFDSRANGYVRGEGCGIVVLKRLSAALEDDDVILALIRGTAVNHDGRSNGLTAPSGPAQRQVIRQALQNANIAPSQISYIEAHGTGTALGDPIEIDSLKAALAPERAAGQKCAIGSVKTNMGHLEAAAGIAGLIKVILSLQHGQIPPHLHLQQLNPLITLADTPFFIPTELQPWPTEEKRLAGVSSFGFGGTNVHVVLEEAPAPLPIVTAGRIERPAHILNLSAQSEPALRALAYRYEQFLATQPEFDMADLCFTANTGRSHFAHRLSVTAESNTQLRGRLAAFRGSLESPGLITGHVPNQPGGKIVFLFTGKGSDYLGMGKQLYATQPTFRAIIRRCDELLRDYSQVPLLSLLYPQPDEPPQPDLIPSTHSVLFALEVALAQLWRSWGIHPDIVMGHSLGEYAAACTAGALTLEQGLSLVAERGQLMESLPKTGMMAVIFAPEARVADAIFPYQRHVAIAAFNGPTNIAISGDKECVQAVLDDLGRQGVESRPLGKVDLAAHSPLVAPIIDQFGHIADQVAFDPLQIPLVSTRTGTLIPVGSMPEADHWRRHLREPVQFVAGVNTLLGQGCRYFLEIGPHPALISMCRRFVPEETAVWLPSLHKGQDDWQVMLRSLSQLYAHGVNADWSGFDRDYLRRKTTLPTYPFQRQRYWIQSKRAPFRETGEVMDNSYTPPPQPAATQGPTRKEEILSQLRGLVGRALHMAPAQVDIHLPFLEMGADSLVLIETIRVVEKTFNVKLSVRQLFEQLTTVEALSAYIDQMMPPEAAPQTTVPSPSSSTLTPTTSQSALENIVNQQLQLMSRQLELLGQAGTAPSPAPVEAPPAPLPAPPIEAEDPADQPKPFIPYAPLAKAPTSHLSPQQQAHLEALTDRVTSRTRKSKQQTQKDRPALADNRASAGFRFSTKEMLYPIIADRSEGAYVWDIDGNKYVDISMGFGVNLFGHNPPFVMTAVQQQLEKGIQLGPQSELVGEVARLICEMTDMERVAFCNSGTEAVMTALRLARTATGRDKVTLFAGSYHGSFDGTLSRDEPINGRSHSVPFAPGIPQNFVEDTLTLEYGEPRSLEIIRAHAHQIAAVLVEPVQSRRPDLQPTQFLHQLREATQENGIALIFDEVITGFRVHPGGAQAWYGVPADIVTYGKIIGGGMPIGVIAGKAAYLDGIDGGMWQYGDASYPCAKTTFFAGTFCKHPLTMSAAHAALNHMKAQGPNLQAALNRRTAELAQHLNDHFRQVGAPLKIVTFGSLFRFAFDQNMDLLFYHLLDKGVYIWEGRNLFLSTAHTEEDINFVIN